MDYQNPTIVALATAVGTGALAIIRLSGPQAQEIFSSCTQAAPLQARRASLRRVLDTKGRVIDELVATYFAAPASFTGEDVVEISCHGGMLVVRRLLERLMQAGAIAAQPGEFSQRAFESGKLDLTQAEAVMDIITASSDLALQAAQNQLGGAISTRVGQAVDQLISLIAHVEAYIDFPDEDISPDSQQALLNRLQDIQQQLNKLLATADEGRLLREGVRTALIGAPNVGKSSLLNCLLGYERAIISEIAGTTRDTIEEKVNIGALCLRLIDTAGIHESQDRIERAGIERSRQAGADADLIIELADASLAPVNIDIEMGPRARKLLVLNKSDLGIHPDWQESIAKGKALCISCAEGTGIKEVEAAIEGEFFLKGREEDSLAAINMRHRSALEEALTHLQAAAHGLQRDESPEFISLDLRDGLEALAKIRGKVDTEEILGAIFSQFCLGK